MGEINFRHPGRETLHARFVITDEDLDEVSAALVRGETFECPTEIPLTTVADETCALVRQTLHFRRR